MAAIAIGTSVVALALYGVQALLAGAAPSEAPVTRGPAPILLLTGTLAALFVAAGITWHRLRPVDSFYRRGGLALVAVFGTFVMAVLATPLHHFLGAHALLALAAAGAGVGLLLLRRPAPARP